MVVLQWDGMEYWIGVFYHKVTNCLAWNTSKIEVAQKESARRTKIITHSQSYLHARQQEHEQEVINLEEKLNYDKEVLDHIQDILSTMRQLFTPQP